MIPTLPPLVLESFSYPWRLRGKGIPKGRVLGSKGIEEGIGKDITKR
jgi:hypothetical protein